MAKLFALVCVLVTLIGVFKTANAGHHHNHALGNPPLAAVPSEDCATVFHDLTKCMSFLVLGSNESKPANSCCLAYESVVNVSDKCICDAINRSFGMGINFNVTKIVALPFTCDVPPFRHFKCHTSALTPALALGPSLSPNGHRSPSTAPMVVNVLPTSAPTPALTLSPSPNGHISPSPAPVAVNVLPALAPTPSLALGPSPNGHKSPSPAPVAVNVLPASASTPALALGPSPNGHRSPSPAPVAVNVFPASASASTPAMALGPSPSPNGHRSPSPSPVAITKDSPTPSTTHSNSISFIVISTSMLLIFVFHFLV